MPLLWQRNDTGEELPNTARRTRRKVGILATDL